MPNLTDEERRARNAEKSRRWRLNNPEAYREMKRRYRSSEKGKAQRLKDEAAYVASGGRAKAEKRRSEKPISEARKAAKKKWSMSNTSYWAAQQSMRRSLKRDLTADEFWILQEAMELAKLRSQLVGGEWHVDHIIPITCGGNSKPDNIQVVPALWNRQKSNKHTKRFLPGHKE